MGAPLRLMHRLYCERHGVFHMQGYSEGEVADLDICPGCVRERKGADAAVAALKYADVGLPGREVQV